MWLGIDFGGTKIEVVVFDVNGVMSVWCWVSMLGNYIELLIVVIDLVM